MTYKRSNSSSSVGIWDKLVYNYRLFLIRLANGNRGSIAAVDTIEEISDLVKTFEQQTGLSAKESSVVEIGFGARPERAFAMTGFFKSVTAIDLFFQF